MLDLERRPAPPMVRGPRGRALRVAHLTTVDMSLALLLWTELEHDVRSGFATFGLSAPGPYAERLGALGVTHVPLPSLSRDWAPRQDVHAALELYRAIRWATPDVLHTHNPKTGVLGRIVGRIAGVPVVVNTCHGLWAAPDDRLRKRLPVYAAEVVAAMFSDAELYQNDADRSTLSRFVAQRKVDVVGNGVDLTRFRPDAAARQRVRQELAVPDDAVLVGGVGRLVPDKGISEFVRTAGQLRHRAEFVWAGPEDGRERGIAASSARTVRFVGERRDMAGFYNALDLFVLPSYREGFSRAAMEAAACGLPMILSDIRGCREIGVHGAEVWLVPPRDSRALQHAVDRLIGDPPLRRRLGDAARRRAVTSFDQRVVAAASVRAYATAARRKHLAWAEGGGTG